MLNFFKAARETAAAGAAQALSPRERLLLMEEIDRTRREELLARLDELAGELLYLGVTPEEIARRCAQAAQGEQIGQGGEKA